MPRRINNQIGFEPPSNICNVCQNLLDLSYCCAESVNPDQQGGSYNFMQHGCCQEFNNAWFNYTGQPFTWGMQWEDAARETNVCMSAMGFQGGTSCVDIPGYGSGHTPICRGCNNDGPIAIGGGRSQGNMMPPKPRPSKTWRGAWNGNPGGGRCNKGEKWIPPRLGNPGYCDNGIQAKPNNNNIGAALPCGNYNGSQCPQGTHRAMRQPDGSCTCVSLSSFPENTRGPKPRPIRKGNIRRGGTLPGKKTIG